AVALWLGLRRAVGELAFLASAMAVLALTPLLKVAFHRSPPEEGIGDYSFPSGHALGTMALAAAVAVLLAGTRWRWPAIALAAVFVAAIGAAVVTSQGHWPSDVLAGWALAIAWVAAVECARRLVSARGLAGELAVRGGGAREARPS